MTFTKVAALALAMAGLSGCVEDTGTSSAPLRTGAATDEQVCLGAVAAQTGNTVNLVSSESSEANTIVMVAVGPQAAPWKCLASGGVVAEVTSMTDEGAL